MIKFKHNVEIRGKSEIPNTEHWIWYSVVFCKIVIAMTVVLLTVVRSPLLCAVHSCKYIIYNKKVKIISNRDRLWAKNLKILQLLEQKIAFQNANIRSWQESISNGLLSMNKPSGPRIKPPFPPPEEKFGEKALWPKISPGRGLLSEFYGTWLLRSNIFHFITGNW